MESSAAAPLTTLGLTLSETDLGANPYELFDKWFTLAKSSSGLNDPNAMCLSTIDENGYPDSRMVLLKGHDERGFIFFTNSLSRKGRALGRTPKASLTFYWDSLGRQLRILGDVEKVSREESDAYFATRARLSQLGAWASLQSEALPDRAVFERRIEDYERRFNGVDVPRPPHWFGYRVLPNRIEFMQNHVNRLHDRFVYMRENGIWNAKRLYP